MADQAGNDSDSDDDMPPPLEDMTDSLSLRQKLSKQQEKKPQIKLAEGVNADEKDDEDTKKHKLIGKRVELFGLSTQKYNGKQGVVLALDDKSGRFAIKLDDEGKSIKIKEQNIKVIETMGGFGKGFLNNHAARSSKIDEDEDDIEVITPKNPKDKPGVLPEVQSVMSQSGNFLAQTKDEWLNPDLLNKLAKRPDLMEMFQNPQFMQAITEFQQNPDAASKKYESNPKVIKFFKDFCELMGDHLTNLADEKEKTAGGSATGSQGTVANPTPEDRRVQEIMARPEVKDALSDQRVQNILGQLRQNPNNGASLMHEASKSPTLMRKVQVLIQSGLLGIQTG